MLIDVRRTNQCVIVAHSAPGYQVLWDPENNIKKRHHLRRTISSSLHHDMLLNPDSWYYDSLWLLSVVVEQIHHLVKMIQFAYKMDSIPSINRTFLSHHPRFIYQFQLLSKSNLSAFPKHQFYPSQWPLLRSRTLPSSRVNALLLLATWFFRLPMSHILTNCNYSLPRWWLRYHVNSLHERPRLRYPAYHYAALT